MATAPQQLFDPQAEKLRQIRTIPALVKYLDEELGWPVGVDDWEDAVYDWQPEELNLKAEHQVAINSIKQLRPLVTGQPWGIFFVDFDKGRLPITVLRRMLNGLIIKSRVQGSGHQTWLARDLLFVSSFGEGSPGHPREIALAHFTDESELGDIPILRVLGWDETDTRLELSYVARTLKEKLRWPLHTAKKSDQDAWRVQWAGAFSLQYRQVINDSKSLALALAVLAKRIRLRVNDVLALENDKGHLRQLHKAFKENLIADLSADGFADMFAQTITYGLFTARASRSSGALVADNLSDMVPSTNPFLKELLQDFLSAAGRDRKKAKRVDFDELGINEVVATLRDVPMDAVLRSFNSAKPGDDPVIHFYEDFLKAYDKAMRAKRGVFYTPSPVVQFIVRSVDEILKTEFGIEDGLASTITWGEYLAREPALLPLPLGEGRGEGSPNPLNTPRPPLTLPKFCTADTPFVQILDPATGTGTFIVEVITQVHAHMLAKWRKQGKVTKTQWQPLWVDYVQKHLLPRLYAFELMMAPYAIAHMKIGLKLHETGYIFPDGGPRVNVFLTNALEPAHAINPGLAFEAPMLAHEAAAANRVKEQLAATVVVGNPPYSGVSNNMFPWIDGLLKGQLPDGTVVSSYYHVDGQPLGERKVWLQDDYVKFIRFGQWRIESSGVGVLGYITNHAYFDNPTFRGMRASLLHAFDTLSFTDLHGSAKKGGSGGQDGPDENVFDIEQGVGVALLTRIAGLSGNTTLVNRSDLWGSRAAKYESLASGSTLAKILLPASPYYFFKFWDETNSADYMNGYALPDILRTNSSGIVTSKDHFVVSLDRAPLIKRIKEFAVSNEVGDALLQRFDLSENYAWSATKARDEVAELANLADFVRKIAYRPFDNRFMFYHPSLVWRTREEVMQHMDGACLSLISCRQQSQEDVEWSLAGVTKLPIESCVISNKTKEINYSFPLWLTVGKSKVSNLSSSYLAVIHSALNLVPTDYQPDDPTAPLHAEKIFHYLYAVLHSPAYRQRYAAFLRTDFPRIPIPGSRAVFDALAQLGGQLVQWHLLEHPSARAIGGGPHPSPLPKGEGASPRWFGADFSLQKVAEKGKTLAELSGGNDQIGKVFINATSGFANARQSTWQHTIGGYQVLHKWLDDRRKAKRSLSLEDITHWLRVYAALDATQALMRQVDVAIDAHGGWPGAFSQNHPPPDASALAAEQVAHKEQLKAQKKSATAIKNRAASVSPTGANSLFDFDDDLDALGAAAGAPPRPKPEAAPAKAAGGKTSPAAPRVQDLTDDQLMCALRAVLAASSPLSRDELIRQSARRLGFARIGAPVQELLDKAICQAVRRGIAANARGMLSLAARSIEDYERDFLKPQLLQLVAAAGLRREEVTVRLARRLGFARVGPVIDSTVLSLLRALVRKGDMTAQGRGTATLYCKA